MRVVIKVGTSTLTHQNGNINIRRIENLCKVISDLKNAGLEIIFVSSWISYVLKFLLVSPISAAYGLSLSPTYVPYLYSV